MSNPRDDVSTDLDTDMHSLDMPVNDVKTSGWDEAEDLYGG
jgi:hypothetical protein